MRLSFCLVAPLMLIVLAAACDTVSPNECWPNTSGGLGGAGTIPIGDGVGATSGDFFSPPPSRPQTSGDASNPCVITPTGCDAKCLSAYEDAAAACGMIADETQRKACQDAAHSVYTNCEASCQQSSDCLEQYKDDCDKVWEKCRDDCPQGNKNCLAECTNTLASCYKKCKEKCK